MGHKIFILPQTERFIVVGVIILIAVLIRVSQFLAASGQNHTPLGAQRSYGIWGGVICPKCQRPFALNFFAINLGIGTKLVRCPYCGKWSITRRQSPDALRAAEAAEAANAENATIQKKTEEEKLKEMVDNSRFSDKG